MEDLLSFDWTNIAEGIIIALAIIFHAFKARSVEVGIINSEDCCGDCECVDENHDCSVGDAELKESVSTALPDVPYDIWDVKSNKGRYTLDGLHNKIETLWSQAHKGEDEPDYEDLKSIARSLNHFINNLK